MNKTIKALLLTAFILPGSGHLLLKRYFSAAAFISSTSIACYLLISKTIDAALKIVDKIQYGEVPADIASLTTLVEQELTRNYLQVMQTTTTILVIIWVVAIIDCYRVARSQEKEVESPEKKHF